MTENTSFDPFAHMIVALDVPDLETAEGLVKEFRKLGVEWFKVGSELFTAAGPRMLHFIRSLGGKIMLDLKYHDTPDTMGRAVRAAVIVGADMLTIHASAGREGIWAATHACGASKILGVTVLTSFGESNEEDVKEFESIFGTRSVATRVCLLARKLKNAGAGGLVCAAAELAYLYERERQTFRELTKVVPGTRLLGVDHRSQKRVRTPAYAMQHGADYVVAGTGLVDQPSPEARHEALLQYCEEIQSGYAAWKV